MERNKLIIIEGPQGVGKTSITDYIRDKLPHTNLLRLSGPKDKSKDSLEKLVKYYEGSFEYLKNAQNAGMNILFDRYFFTEEIYCRLGFKDYSFTKYYKKFVNKLVKLDFDIYYITLHLSDVNNYEKRLKREGKAKVNYAPFSLESSVKQQEAYLQLASELSSEYSKDMIIKNFATDQGSLEDNLKYIKLLLEIEVED